MLSCPNVLSAPSDAYSMLSWDKKKVWLAGWCVHIPTSFCMFFLDEGASWSLLGATMLIGLSFGGSSYLYKAIQAVRADAIASADSVISADVCMHCMYAVIQDAIDYDELRTTRRREGQYITFWALIPKLVAIPAASIPLVILEQVPLYASSI